MKRIFSDFAYSEGPRSGCWWDETCTLPKTPSLRSEIAVDVAIIGGGYTGVSAALTLAGAGVRVAVLEQHDFGWGASGRNGGFCCLGGGLASDAELDARHGRAARLEFRQAEKDAITHVERVITQFSMDVDRHSNGETQLAHRPKDMDALRGEASIIAENYGVTAELIEQKDLATRGMQAGPFFGALTIPLGFALNPRKYMAGLVRAAGACGALLFSHSPATSIEEKAGGVTVTTADGKLMAGEIIMATNGYSSEDLPRSLAGTYMPTQSTVLVTRPINEDEVQAQGWSTDQMSFDTRNLLHYFRLMPDRRFLFGMRGGLRTGPAAERRARARTRRDFERLFPAWAHIATSHSWSGFVSLARNKVPFVGKLPGSQSLWAAMCYHGNGVAMASYAGKLVADMILSRSRAACPEIICAPLAKFPLGRARRLLMPPVYSGLMLRDAR